MAARPTRNWRRMQPTSLRHALELSKEHARDKLNLSVERIAELMGLADHYWLYKVFQSGRLPANLIRPFESACGIDYVTRWIAGSGGKLLIEMPTGRNLKSTDVVELHKGFAAALQLLTSLYEGKADRDDAMAALTTHLESVAWHRANIGRHAEPELDFGGSEA